MSPFTFLDSKYSPILLPDVYAPRQKLIDKFELAKQNTHIYVSAPVGSGKSFSTLLWLTKACIKPIWLTLNEYDNIFQAFYKQLALALLSTQPHNERAKKILTSPHFTTNLVKNIQHLIAELYYEDTPYSLVFDDLHFIKNEKILRDLPVLLNRLPSNYCMIYISQYDFPKELKTEYYNDYSTINEKDLAFSSEDTSELFLGKGKVLSETNSEKITMLTWGYAHAIHILANYDAPDKKFLTTKKQTHSNRTHRDILLREPTKSENAEYANSFPDVFFVNTFEKKALRENFLEDYFETNIWEHWSHEVRSFCLALCVLDDFDYDIALELSENKKTKCILEKLVHKNAFLSYNNDGTYHFHCLFKNFLLLKLEASRLDNKRLYKKIAFYYKSKKEYYKALYFALLTEDAELINTFILCYFFYRQKNLTKELDFLERIFHKDFSFNIFEKSPIFHLLAIRYYNLFLKKDDAIYHRQRMLEKLEEINRVNKRVVAVETIQKGKTLFELKAFDSVIINFVLWIIYIDNTCELTEKIRIFNNVTEKYGENTINIINLSKNLESENIISIRKRVNFTITCIPLAHRAVLDCSPFSINPHLFDQVDRTYGALHWGHWFLWKYLIRGFLVLEQNNLNEASAYLQQAQHVFSQVRCRESMFAFYVFEHTVLFYGKKYEEAQLKLNQLEQFIEETPPFMRNFLAYKTKYATMQGNHIAAQAWLELPFTKRMLKKPVSLLHIFQRLINVRSFLVLGRIDEAFSCLTNIINALCNTDRLFDYAEAQILHAIIYWLDNRKKEAVYELKSVIIKLYPYNYTKIFADEGKSILPILKKVLQSVENEENLQEKENIDTLDLIQYIKRIISLTSSFARRHSTYIDPKKISKSIKFSKQQAKIMEYLAAGYSNADICVRMELKITTIKSHISAIYKKLEVNNAKGAVQKAKDLKLL